MSAIQLDNAALRRSAAAATLLPGFEGTVLPEWLRARLADGLGGVCLFGENIRSLHQLREWHP
jgi:beta-N-acetylhexosaminidase